MRTILIDSTVRVLLPYSEVCCHLKVENTWRYVRVLRDGAQILNNDLTPFSFPVTWGEAGIGRDGDGRPVLTEAVQTSNLLDPVHHIQDGLSCPWCGATWQRKPGREERSMQHDDDCFYIVWMAVEDVAADMAEAVEAVES